MSNLSLSRSERLDSYVTGHLGNISRAYAAKLIAKGSVTVNNIVVTKPGYKLRQSDTVTIASDYVQNLEIPDIILPVLYEDVDCVVIDKPAGILSHSKGVFNPEATVASWLRGKTSQMQGDRAGIVHRLDRATSGVMICAKNPSSLSWLQKQFSKRKVKKTYIAVVQGQIEPLEAVIDMPIERNPKKPQTFRVGSNGKMAVTSYKTIKSGRRYSEIELSPTTGRTHQLRVHLAKLGHPIVGDTLYGGEPADRLMLHAKNLELTLFSHERKVFTSKVPDEFDNYLS